MKYYNTEKIDKKNSIYNVIFGERSNGKTYALLKKAVNNYFKDGSQFAYVRRWKEDITGRRASMLFSGINENLEVEKHSKGKFKGVYYWAGKFYFCNYDEKGKPIYSDLDLFGFAFALSDSEHDKSTSFPNIRTIIFDEFLTNKLYLNDEFVLFMNTISTIVRKRTDVKIYMLGNTVSKFCPYFKEMGLNNILKMKQGSIDVYHYGDSNLKVSVEYCSTQENKSESNKYFAFDNPKLSMITGGAWELDIHPHLPMKYSPKNILFTFFIDFNDSIYQCEIVGVDQVYFIYIHTKTTPLKDVESDLIYSLEYNPRMNYNRNLFKPTNKIQEKIRWFFKTDRVFYQNNEVGNSINNFVKFSSKGL
jgi:hypothetical protein